jgi:regulator of sirC expression with transglutaminase-like and TPR domain
VRVVDGQGVAEERWVVAEHDVEVRMPTPRSKPVPHVVAADGEGELELEEPDEPAKAETLQLGAKSNEVATVSGLKAKPSKAQRVQRAKRLLKLGTRHLLAGRLERAKESLIECVQLDPEAAECHRSLGTLYRRARSTHRAREHFQRYLELTPGAPDAERIQKLIDQ